MKAGIAGAGVMGQLMALMLVNDGWDVTLFDHHADGNCSHAAAGLLTPAAELDKCERSIFGLGVDSLTGHWPAIIRQLHAPVYFKSDGSIIVSHQRDHGELRRVAAIIASKVSDDHDIQQLDHASLNMLEPELSRFASGYYLPQAGQIDNQQLMKTLQNFLGDKGVIMHLDHDIDDISAGYIHANQQSFHYDLTIDCRGLGAKKVFQQLRGLRGELMWLHAPDVKITRPVRLIHPRYSLYIVPRPNQIYLLGASEIEAEDYSAISVQTTLELLSAAYSMHAGFAEARVIKTVTHCRPVLNHHRPQLKYSDGLIAINGLYRHGFLIAPALAHEVMQCIRSGFSSIKFPEIWSRAA